MKPIVFHNEADQELEEAMEFYDQRSEGLGKALLEEVQQTLTMIQDFPEIGSTYPGTGLRHFVLKRFPYLVVYSIRPSAIVVAAIAHGRRKPGYWTERNLEL